MGKKNNVSGMGNFLAESVTSAIIPIVKNNTPFIITEHGKKCYIGMLLDVDKIGGINKKMINDKDKGGVIECIKSGRIDAYITQELNDNNKLLFIPTYGTLDCLSDYSVFTKVDGYEFVKLNDKLEIISHTNIFASYDNFRAIGAEQLDIKTFIVPDDVIVSGSADDPTVSHSGVSAITDKAKNVATNVVNAVAPVVTNVVNTVAPTVTKIVDKVKDKFIESSGISDILDEAEMSKISIPSSTNNTVSAQSAAAVIEQEPEPEPEPDIVFDETQVLTSIERIFHADNLDLPLNSEPFDQLFTLNNHLIKFSTDQRDGYVNAELNRMATDANRDLTKLRADNIKKLRDKYFTLMSMRIQDIQLELDIEDQTKRYGAFKAGLEGNKNKRISDISDTIEQRQKLLNDDFETRLNDVCEIAKQQARSDFKARYQRQHNDDLNAVEGVVRAEITADHSAAMNELYTARRSDALTTLDLNITGVLNELTVDYQQMFDEENALYVSAADAMREYSKQLHLDDAKRLAVEEEHLRITNEVNDARTEAAAKIALIQREFETANAALSARATATIEQAENATKLLREQMQERTATLEQDKQAVQQQLADALERADRAQEFIKADYEHRLAQSADDRDSWKQTLESYKEQHKHNNMITTVMVVAIIIACVAGGFVAGGVYWNRVITSNATHEYAPAPVKIIQPDETTVTTVITEAIPDDNYVDTNSVVDTAAPIVSNVPLDTNAPLVSDTPLTSSMPAVRNIFPNPVTTLS